MRVIPIFGLQGNLKLYSLFKDKNPNYVNPISYSNSLVQDFFKNYKAFKIPDLNAAVNYCKRLNTLNLSESEASENFVDIQIISDYIGKSFHLVEKGDIIPVLTFLSKYLNNQSLLWNKIIDILEKEISKKRFDAEDLVTILIKLNEAKVENKSIFKSLIYSIAPALNSIKLDSFVSAFKCFGKCHLDNDLSDIENFLVKRIMDFSSIDVVEIVNVISEFKMSFIKFASAVPEFVKVYLKSIEPSHLSILLSYISLYSPLILDLFEKCEDYLKDHISSMNIVDIVNILNTFSISNKGSRQFYNLIEEQIMKKLSIIERTGLVSILNSYSQCGFYNPELFISIEKIILKEPYNYNLEEICYILASLSKISYPNKELFSLYEKTILENLDSMDEENMIKSYYGYFNPMFLQEFKEVREAIEKHVVQYMYDSPTLEFLVKMSQIVSMTNHHNSEFGNILFEYIPKNLNEASKSNQIDPNIYFTFICTCNSIGKDKKYMKKVLELFDQIHLEFNYEQTIKIVEVLRSYDKEFEDLIQKLESPFKNLKN